MQIFNPNVNWRLWGIKPIVSKKRCLIILIWSLSSKPNNWELDMPFNPAVAVTYLGPAARSEDALALEIAQEILAGGESSRLYQRLVYEKALAQSVEFQADLREDLGLLTFQVVLASGKKVADAERALFAEIEKIAAQPVSDAELAKAKNRLLTLLALLGRRAPELRHLRRWLGPILAELDVPRTLVGGWFAASAAGCLLAAPDGEPNYRYIEVGLES